MEVIVELLSTPVGITVVEIFFGIVFYWTGWFVSSLLFRYPKPTELSNARNRHTRLFLVDFYCLFRDLFVYYFLA